MRKFLVVMGLQNDGIREEVIGEGIVMHKGISAKEFGLENLKLVASRWEKR
jgi:hypothetical protein